MGKKEKKHPGRAGNAKHSIDVPKLAVGRGQWAPAVTA